MTNPETPAGPLERLLRMQLDAFDQIVAQQLQTIAGRPLTPWPPLPSPPLHPGEGERDRPDVLVEGSLPATVLDPPKAPIVGTSPPASPLSRVEGGRWERGPGGEGPLTEAQADLYTVAQLGEEASRAYNEPGVIALTGYLDLDVLRRSLQLVVDRHEALRTVIPPLPGNIQRVLPDLTLDVPLTDASAYPPAEHEALTAAWLAEESRRSFDLAAGPLFRAAVLRLSVRQHLLCIYAHHIVTDGLSMALIFTEALEAYETLRAGRRPELPPALSFREYSVWLAEQVAEIAPAAEAHWREAFRDGVPVFEPPTDRPRTPVRTFRGARWSERVSAAERAVLLQFGRGRGATLFVTLLAAWTALLHRWTGQDALVAGVPTSRRPLEGSDRLVGFATDLAPIPSRVAGSTTFAEHLAAIRRRVLDAHDLGAFPFSRVVRALDLPRDPGRAPLVNAVFNMDQPLEIREAGDLTVAVRTPAMTHVKLDLTLQPLDTPAGLSLDLDYATALFDPATAQRLLARLRTLLAAAVAAPDTAVADLDVLPESEREQILREWSGAGSVRPERSDVAVHELFAAWAASAPEAVALETADGAVSYGELSRQAGRLAGHLRSLGVGLETRVGVCLERSADLVTALLAVLQAGGAYVPLDPDYPRERLEWMLADSGARLLLTEGRLAGSLDAERIVCLDEIPPDGDVAAPVQVPADALAYLMYTSGSTGRPKAVAVPHRAIVRLVREGTCARLDRDEVLALFAPASFDASTLEVWGALANGARLVVPPAGPLSPTELAGIVERHGVTTLWLTSALFQQVALSELPRLKSLRQLLSGGDVLPPETVRRTLRELPGLRLINGYGPTENTTFTCTWPMDAPEDVPEEGWGIPVGRPISGTDVYVVDPEQRLLPAGSFGELVTGGEGLARGYHGRPDLTAERFVPHPFSSVPGARLYRIGDRARFRHADDAGAVEFLGRLDRQVKVRGFRIEPGEVEAALAKQPGVREAAVAVRREQAGDERLVAFVTLEEAGASSPQDLRAALAEALPPYMVPSEVVRLERMPLTPSGKVDRRALTTLEIHGEGPREREAPRNPTEEIVTGVWSEVLRREPIGIRESFFDLGGHSLLATQVLSRIRETFRVEIPLAAFFADPTVAGMAAVIENARHGSPAASIVPVRPVPRDQTLPLSFAQQRLWFFERFHPGSALYNVPLRIRLRGPLQAQPLAGALAALFQRHESLRTVFAEDDGQPVQQILTSLPSLPLIDLSALSEPARAAEEARLDHADAVRPFDLAAGPLLRATLIRLEARHHRLYLHLHHIVSDAWSIAILGDELAAFYRTLAAGGRITADWPLPPLAVQYADFAAWQRAWLQGEELERQLGYWRERLSGAPEALELPADHPRPAVQTFRGAVEPVTLPVHRVRPLERLGRRQGATLFMTLLAGFAALLRRATGQTDLLIGSPVANRNRADTEGLIGFFVNTLVLRVDLADDPPFSALVERVRETALEAYAHQDVPFERLVELLAPERDLSRNALVQVVFALQNAPRPDLRFGAGLSAGLEDARTDTAKLDLSVSLQEEPGGPGDLTGEIEYAADLFEPESVRRLFAVFETLLAGAAAAPETPVSDLPLLTAAERRQVVVDWNRTRTSAPRGAVLPRLFAEQARRAPDAVAVDAEGARLTYGELDRRSDRLAWTLRGLGAGPEVRVALHLQRSPEMIVAMLAVLKAGGAYVPLDPSDPEERLRFILEDSGAALRIGNGPAPAWLAADGRYLDLSAPLEGPRDPFPPSIADGARLAYLIYTSGSTGRPKGVAVPHAAVPRLAVDNLFLPLSAADRIAHLSNTAFDASVLEIWAAFLNGAALAVVPREVAASPPALLAEVDRRGITVLVVTAALFHQLAAELEQGRGPRGGSLRAVLTGGDTADPGWTATARAALPAAVRLLNAYGPTESTSMATFFEVAPSGLGGVSSVPIGRPLAHTRAHVLDSELRPVPPGLPGELCLGGDGLARGYWGRPDLTAERFVPDPFAGEADLGAVPGGRLYRTGDRARQLLQGEAEGALEHLGRLDHQIKLRGYRVEPGEIEAVLAAHPAVAEAVVAVREDGPAGRSLAAYAVPEAGATVEVAELRSWLEARLPAYMVPARFAIAERLPLTDSGKLDRRSLAALQFAEERPEPVAAETEAPRTPVEEAIAGFWTDLLEIEHAGLADNFFENGGHSLLATILLSRLRGAFDVEVTLVEFFQEPTIAGLARRVEAARVPAVPPVEEAPSIPEGPAWTAEYPLSFGQERLWFFDRLAPGSAVYHMPVRFLLRGEVREDVLAVALAEVVRRHEVLRTVFVVPDGEERPVQRVLPATSGRAPALAVVDLAGLPEARLEPEAARLQEDATRHPFDLERGPLLRAFLLRRGERERTLLIAPHHIVVDGWSLDLLAGELAALYRAILAGAPSPLAELPLQYGEFADRQRQWLTGGEIERQLAHWRERLEGYPGALELPADRPRPAVQTFRGGTARRHFAVSPQAVRSLAGSAGATPFMVLLAAWQALLARVTGQEDVVVGTPVANRNRAETERLIGFFVSFLPLRTDLSGDPPFGRLVERARDTALAAFSHQDLPFEVLVEALAPGRDLSRNPLAQVSFTVLGPPHSRLDLGPGVEATFEEVGTGTAKFDLAISLQEDGAGGWIAETEQSADLFEAETADRLLGLFETFLSAAVAAPQTRLWDLPLLTGEETRQVLAWSRTAPGLDREVTIHALVTEHAARRREAVALVSGEEAWTYADLDRRAGRLARRLRALGVGPEVAVGVFLERSAGLIAALLGVLQAGGAYVPLDPEYPAERLAFLLADSGVRILITDERLAGRLPVLELELEPELELELEIAGRVEGALSRASARGRVGEGALGDAEETPSPTLPRFAGEGATAPAVLFLNDLLTAEEVGEDPDAPASAATPDNTAYRIYTSGSTGVPKGVDAVHRGVVRLVQRPAFASFEPDDVWLLLAPLSFDASTLEIWGCLTNGGRLVVPPPGQLTPEQIGGLVEHHGVTVLHLTTALFPQVVDAALPHLRPLRQLLVGGDVMPPATARRFLEARPDCVLTNNYGPTENTTLTASYVLPRHLPEGPVSIGRPLQGTDVYVVDRNFRPVPAGVAGELVTGGAGLARGYHRRPDLTAERFVPHPFAERPGERLYRTGDRAAWISSGRPDGNLAFFGRADQQVKVRGFRVEPGEVEAALLKHDGVREAVVLARRLEGGDESLVAFTVPADGAPDPAALRAWLAERLPAYMVPGRLIAVPELPRTPSGKVDRQALARSPLLAAVAATGSSAPRTPHEDIVATVWNGVLGGERTGIHDSFFDSGGHSLLATVLLSRLRAALGVDLTLAAFFQDPTVAGLAARVEQLRQEQSGLALPPLGRAPREAGGPPLRLSFAQERLWLVDQLQPGGSVYNSYMPVRLHGRLDLPLLERVLTEIARRHEVLRTTFVPTPEGPVQVIAPPSPWRVPILDLSGLPEPVQSEELRRQADAEGRRTFDLARGPLRRATLVRLAPESHALLFNLHHSICDGWSLEILTRELEALFRAFASGQPSPLPELAIQYADFAAWQRGWLAGETYDRQLDWWRRQLGERPPVLDLPTDRPRPRVQTSRGGLQLVALSPELTAAVQRLARDSGGTAFTLLLAAFQLLLHRLSGQDRVSVGTPVANRTRPEIEGLIGFFVNTVVLSSDLSGDPTVAELLARVREVTLGAFDHQDFPFEQLVAALETDRDTSRQPLFQVMLVLQNNKAAGLDLPGLSIGWIDSGGDQTPFDLVLGLAEDGGQLAGSLAYNADLFDAATVERWAGWLVELLEAMVADPQRRLSELPFVEEARRLREERAAAAAREEEERRRAAQAEVDDRRRQISDRRGRLSPERLAVLQKWVQGKGEGNEA